MEQFYDAYGRVWNSVVTRELSFRYEHVVWKLITCERARQGPAGGRGLQVAGACRWGACRWQGHAGGRSLQMPGPAGVRGLQVAGLADGRGLQVPGACRWQAHAGGSGLQLAGACRRQAPQIISAPSNSTSGDDSRVSSVITCHHFNSKLPNYLQTC